MKNLSILLLLSIIAISFNACRKDKGPKALGFVLASGTGTPIQGATVDLYQGESFTGPWTFDRTLTTGSDGAYEFVIPDNEAYRLSAYHPEYFEIANGYFQLTKDDREDNAILTPHAYIKLHVENVAPVDEFDRINIGLWSEILNDTPEYIGTLVSEEETFLRRGNQVHQIAWKVTKNGSESIFKDSIYVSGLDTTFYEILY